MKIKTKPDVDSVGKYIAFIEDYKSPSDLDLFLKKNKGLFSKFYINSIFKNKIESDLNISWLNKEEIEEKYKEKITIPKWILTEDNFEKAISGKWNEIMPITAEFTPTLNCNFRCNQCSYSVPKQKLGVWKKDNSKEFSSDFENQDIHMTLESAKKIIDGLKSGGVKNILFTGGGEPFVNPDVTIKGMFYAKEKGLTIGLYSNGSLLNKEIIKDIFKINPLFIRISIYGSNPESFSKYTNQSPKLYKHVLENVRLLAQEKIKTKSSTQIGLSFLLHPDTINDLDQIEKYLMKELSPKELKVINSCRFTPAVDYFGGPQHSDETMRKIFLFIENNIKPKLDKFGIDVKLYFHRLNDLNKKKTYKKCRASGWYLEVGPSGDAFICCEKLFSDNSKIGNLKDQSIKDIYNSDLRKKVIDNIDSCECKECPPVCKPHELNKIFDNIDVLVKKGNIDSIRKWRNDILEHGKNVNHFAGKLNDFES